MGEDNWARINVALKSRVWAARALSATSQVAHGDFKH